MPALDLNGAAAGTSNTGTFTENAAAFTLAPEAVVTDADDTNLESATVTISSGFLALNDFLSINGTAAGNVGAIAFEYNGFTGVMTLTGTATLAQYQSVLRLIKFQSISEDPGTSRTITWTVNDGDTNSSAVTTTITVTEVNDRPFGPDNSKTINEDTTYTFATADFGFSDLDGNSFLAVRVTTLATNGTIFFDADGAGGAAPVAVAAGTFISAADIGLGRLTFVPDANEFGTPYGSFTFQVQDDGGTANGGQDTQLNPSTFTFNVNDVAEPVFTPTEGDDTLNVTSTDPVNVNMLGGNDTVNFGSFFTNDDVVNGGAGSDKITLTGNYTATLGSGVVQNITNVETLTLLNGTFTLTMADIFVASGQTLTVDASTLSAAQVLTFNGGAETNGNFAVTAGAANDVVTGGSGTDSLNGGGGNDTLNGGAGNDVMTGGLGNDTYSVNAQSDVIVESAGQGDDTVRASLSYVLGAGLSIETLATTSAGSTTALNLTGNELGQSIFGNAGSNILNGGGGDDALNGLGGNDTYIVDSLSDVVVEGVGQGDDTVIANFNYVLTAGAEVETITNSTAANLTLTGNEFGQSIFGNAGINFLNGGGGVDQLVGFGDNDVLDGGSGADVLRGGTGNDSYVVDGNSDLLFENVGEGDDLVVANVSGFILAAGVEIETITNTTAANLNLTGNEFGQTIFGNAGVNTLNGSGGNDQLLGFGDNDTLVGGAGADVLRGGTGNDGYNVDNASDLVFENSGEGDDTLSASVSYTLASGVSIETMGTTNGAGTAAIDLTGNDIAQSIFGNAGVNQLRGDGGNDSLSGFEGNDVLIGGSGNDVLNGGADRDDYRFNTTLNAATNVDTVVGFVTITDGISLDDAVFTALAPGALPAGAFRIGASAQDGDDRIIYDNTTGALFYDADGVGGVAQVQFATLQGAPVLAGSDFVVI